MSAYFESGFCVRQPSWHGQEVLLDEHPDNWADARQIAELTWEPVELTPYTLWDLSAFVCHYCFGTLGKLHVETCPFAEGRDELTIGNEILPEGSVVTADGVFLRDSDHKAIARPDSKLVLGVRSDEYSTIYHGAQNELGEYVSAAEGRASMEEIIDAFRGADGSLKFETTGVVREGREVYALLYLDEPYEIKGDSTTHLPFLAILNRHAGGGCRVMPTQVRVVCWNTFQAAEREGEQSGRMFTFRHVGDVAGRIAEARETIAGLRSETAEYVEMANELTQLNVTDEHLQQFLSEFLPNPAEQGAHVTERVQANVDAARAMFKSIYLDSVTTEGVRGTAFGLLQTSTEYLDHARAYRNRDSYLGRSILRPEPLKTRALEIVRRVVK